MNTPLLPPPTSDLPPPSADLPPPATPTAPAGRQGQRRWGPWHIVAIVAGCLLVLPGLGMIAGGTAAALAQAISTDDDGYFTFDIDRLGSDGVAVAAIDLWLDGDGVDGVDDTWLFDWLDVDVRLRVEGAGPTDEVFVGIARAADVEAYLGGAAYSDVVELDGRAPRYDEIEGAGDVAPPADQDFWVISAVGDGEQEVVWEARGGRWAAVVMNADGSPEVGADVQVGARSGAVIPIAVTLIVVGVLVTAGGVVLLVIGIRGRRSRDDESAIPGAPTGAPLAPPSAPSGAPAAPVPADAPPRSDPASDPDDGTVPGSR